MLHPLYRLGLCGETQNNEVIYHVLTQSGRRMQHFLRIPTLKGAAQKQNVPNIRIHRDWYRMPLNVIIIGAGIAGLCATISLRQQGHSVQVCETL